MGVLTVGDNQYVLWTRPISQAENRAGRKHGQGGGRRHERCGALSAHCRRRKEAVRNRKRALQKAQKKKQPAILVINKIDLIKEKTDLLSVILEYNKLYDFAAVARVGQKRRRLSVLWRKSTSLPRTAYICSMRTPSPTSPKGCLRPSL